MKTRGREVRGDNCEVMKKKTNKLRLEVVRNACLIYIDGQSPRVFGGSKHEGGRLYALYDVLLAMFCNEWTWVSFKMVQIVRVEKDTRRLRPCGRWKKERRLALPNSVNSYPAINLLARGLTHIIQLTPPKSGSCLLNVGHFYLICYSH